MHIARLTPFFFLVACASAVRPPARPASRETAAVKRTFTVDITFGDRVVAFHPDVGWLVLVPRKTNDSVTLVTRRDGRMAIGIFAEEAEIGSVAEEVADLADYRLARSGLYDVKKLDKPAPVAHADPKTGKVTTVPDEDLSFSQSGVDAQGRPMSTYCRVKLVSGRGFAAWSIAYWFGPTERVGEGKTEVDHLVETAAIGLPSPAPAPHKP